MSPCYRAIVSRGRVNMTKLLFDVTDWTKMPHTAIVRQREGISGQTACIKIHIDINSI